tara:strand:+ start:126 stop:347 length:222 start_codon:yes stop_codon:yes gene_type:complete
MDTEKEKVDVTSLSVKIMQLIQDNEPDFAVGMGALCLAIGQAALTWGIDEEEAVGAVTKCMKHMYANERETMQ